MAEYDTSIRVGTKVDSSELDKVAKTFKDIEGNADNAKDKVDELDKSGSDVNADGYKEQSKELEKINTQLDKNIKKQKEAVQAQTESPDYRSTWTEEEEARIDALIAKTKEQKELAGQDPETEATREVTFDWKSNAEQQAQTAQQVEEIASEMERAKAGIADADQHMNQLRVDVEEYAATLKELEAQGQYFGDDDYDQVYLAWRNATDAVKEYEANLRSLTDKGMAEIEARIAKEEQINAKKREQEAEEQKLQSIRVNAQVSNQKLVDLLGEQIRLQERLSELKKAGLTAGYQEYDNITARLKQIKE
jgi:chromosome segregation ATPase